MPTFKTPHEIADVNVRFGRDIELSGSESETDTSAIVSSGDDISVASQSQGEADPKATINLKITDGSAD